MGNNKLQSYVTRKALMFYYDKLVLGYLVRTITVI